MLQRCVDYDDDVEDYGNLREKDNIRFNLHPSTPYGYLSEVLLVTD